MRIVFDRKFIASHTANDSFTIRAITAISLVGHNPQPGHSISRLRAWFVQITLEETMTIADGNFYLTSTELICSLNLIRRD